MYKWNDNKLRVWRNINLNWFITFISHATKPHVFQNKSFCALQFIYGGLYVITQISYIYHLYFVFRKLFKTLNFVYFLKVKFIIKWKTLAVFLILRHLFKNKTEILAVCHVTLFIVELFPINLFTRVLNSYLSSLRFRSFLAISVLFICIFSMFLEMFVF